MVKMNETTVTGLKKTQKTATYQTAADGIRAEFDEKAYPLEAVMRAAYSMTPGNHVFFDRAAAGKVALLVQPKKRTSAKKISESAARLEKLVADELVRLTVNERGAGLREKLFKDAMSRPLAMPSKPARSSDSARQAELIELDEELRQIIEQARTMSFTDDPLGIGVPVKKPAKKGAKK